MSRIEAIEGSDLPSVESEREPKNSVCKLAEIQSFLNQTIDIYAIVLNYDEPRSVNCKTGGAVDKQRLYVVDDSKSMVALDIWGSRVNTLNDFYGECIYVKKVKVERYRDMIYMNLLQKGTIETKLEDSDDVVKRLRDWWMAEGLDSDFDELKPKDDQ